MDTKPTITLPNNLIERCYTVGRLIVENLSNGLSNASLAVSSHGAELDSVLQANAKMAECAFCLWANIDPLKEIRWDGLQDGGHDVLLRGIRFDIKYTQVGWYLIWPLNKRSFFDSKRFDALLLVRGASPVLRLEGWCSKQFFKENYEVAGEGHKLNPGTWCLHERRLWPASELNSPAQVAARIKPAAKAEEEKKLPPTWSAVQAWLYGQEDYRERFGNDPAFRDLEWELDVIKKLIRLTEIVQLLGPQFLQLMKRNEQMLSQPMAQHRIPKTEADDSDERRNKAGTD